MSVAKGSEGRTTKSNMNTFRVSGEFYLNMQIKIFTIPVSDAGNLEEELNRFLRAHKILEVENQLVSNENGALWCFCVKYIGTPVDSLKRKSVKIDYKNELDEKAFKVFSKLREIRKQLASEDAVPAYAICTDHELAEMARLHEITDKELLTVKGFGEKKLEKYGKRIIDMFAQNIQHEKSR